MKKQNSINYICQPLVAYEYNDQPSMTVPNEALTVRQIFEKYATGTVRLDNVDRPYDEMADHDSVDIEKLAYQDMTEIDEFKSDLAVKMLDKENQLKAFRAKQKEELDKKLKEEEEVRAYLKQMRQTRKGEPIPSLSEKDNAQE